MEATTCVAMKVLLFVIFFQLNQHVQQDDRTKTKVLAIVDLMGYSDQENVVLVNASMYPGLTGSMTLEKICLGRSVLVMQLVLEEVLLGDVSCHDLLA